MSDTQKGRIDSFVDETVGHVVFNNSGKMNAMNLAMWSSLHEAMDNFERDPSVRSIVLSGAGERAFVSGADIADFEEHRSSPESVAHYDHTYEAADHALYVQPKPTIAKIQGYCIGGGMGLAVGCDIRICSEDAQFGIPAAKLGLGYGFDGVKRLYDIVGPANAAEIFFSARLFNADEALQMGLVSRVVPREALDDAVSALTERIAVNAPMTIAAAKTAIRMCAQPDGKRDYAALEAEIKACFDSKDYAEGRLAFTEKRKPEFKGR